MTTRTAKKINWLSLLLLSGVLLGPLAAQNAPPAQQPPDPRVHPAPARAAWTISFKYNQPDQYPKTSNPIDAAAYDAMRKAHPRLIGINVVKAEDRRQEVEHYADGTDTTRWIVGDVMTTDYRPSHRLETMTSGQSQMNFKDEFYNLAWVKKAHFLGHKAAGGVDCFAYEGNAPDSGPTTIYVNAKNGLPQQIETADGLMIYTFTDSADPLPVPEEIQKRIKAFQATLLHGGV